MAQLAITKPAAFAGGVVGSLLSGAVTPNDNACHLAGSATFSWLLRFDTTTGALQTGGSRPAAAPAGPYAFIDEVMTVGGASQHVQPATLTAPLSSTCTFDSTAGDLLLPVFLGATTTPDILLPLHALRLHAGTMSADHNCIGRFNAETLDPANSCLPDAAHASFTPAATADAHIVLEQADTIVLTALGQSLCVLLSGNAALYGVQSGGVLKCKRDASNKIVFQGDWCSATDQAANLTCADSMRFSSTFAAQAVQIQ